MPLSRVAVVLLLLVVNSQAQSDPASLPTSPPPPPPSPPPSPPPPSPPPPPPLIPAECQLKLGGEEWLEESVDRMYQRHRHRHLIPFHTTVTPCRSFLNNATYYMRSRSTDRTVAEAIFLNQEFDFVDKLFPGNPVLNMLDLGGNGGYATAYLASRYPKAQIVALEPFLSNFGLSNINTRQYSNVVVMFGAITDVDGWLEIQKNTEKLGEWGIRVVPRANIDGLPVLHPIPGYSMATIMNRFRWDVIDFLKVDVEGAEVLLFNNASLSTGWLDKITCLSIEYHDRDNEGCCHYPVEAKLYATGFEFKFFAGELFVYCRKGYNNAGHTATAGGADLADAAADNADTSSTDGSGAQDAGAAQQGTGDSSSSALSEPGQGA